MVPYAYGCCRRLIRAGAVTLGMLVAVMLLGHACAQSGEPIKIGQRMSLTGRLAPNGRSALLAQKIWQEETNAKGGMLGRPVKLIYHDDKSSPSEIPPIYTKLADVDKFDLVFGACGTALTAPAMPIIIEGKKTFIRFLALAVLSQNPKQQTVAIVAGGDQNAR
jgi:branched-chain amino acid transport system substrate-binding protein